MTDNEIKAFEALLEKARQAKKNAYVPYSKFRVGAALLTDDSKIFTGCNIENVSFGATNCAERTAIFKAVSEGYHHFKALAISGGDDTIFPCGICRQVISEFAPDCILILGKKDGYEIYKFSELLPHSFSDFKTEEY